MSILALSPHEGFHRASIAISLDYETSAPHGNIANLYSRLRGHLLNPISKVVKKPINLTFCYGMGYGMRKGADNIMHILQKYNAHATWFCTGHVLLKENKDRKAFHINQILPYATKDAGFTDIVTWRRNKPTFFYEPYGDYKKYPYWYFGDQASKLKTMGEDIECHTFSHPYVALEAADNVKIDIEDWQNTAEINGFRRANILAFPFCGDAYKYYHRLDLITSLGKNIAGEDYIITPLSKDIINILKNAGIELLVRCGSKYQEQFSVFKPYDNSELYYMPDIGFSNSAEDINQLSDAIKAVIDRNASANIWLHPINVFTIDEIQNFEMLIRSLLEKQKEELLWFDTISTIWEHFKKVQQCNMEISKKDKNGYIVNIINKNNSHIENLGIDIYSPNLSIDGHRSDLLRKQNKIVIKKIDAGNHISFDCKILN
ncbi:MAG: polysaccharide deacetylase family protein [Candidatus Omnitrophota bacterium]|nr:polysaccharide deacetylase family protein [Candidatus Omnitrophota bacterium]